MRLFLACRALSFVVMMPGTVAVLVPCLLVSGSVPTAMAVGGRCGEARVAGTALPRAQNPELRADAPAGRLCRERAESGEPRARDVASARRVATSVLESEARSVSGSLVAATPPG
jgi:hypothetical protein